MPPFLVNNLHFYIKLNYKLYKNMLSRTNLILATCIFFVALSLTTAVFGESGMIVNSHLIAEYEDLVYENDKKQAQVDILKANLEETKAEYSNNQIKEEKIIYQFSDSPVTFSFEENVQEADRSSFSGLSFIACMILSLSASILYLGCVVLFKKRWRKNSGNEDN